MEITEKKEKTVTTTEIVGYSCNICGKEERGDLLSHKWCNVICVTEMIEDGEYDICSPKCFFKLLEYLGDSQDFVSCQMPIKFTDNLLDFVFKK